MTVIAAADGSALGNPGPAGWAWYIDEDRWACGGWPHGTNNQGELTAVLDLLRQTAGHDDELLIYCDSVYVINSVTKWLPGWKRKGWRKGDGKPVLNVEIMKQLDQALQGRRVRFEWVKGHSGHPLNEEADRLANGAAVAFSKGGRPDPGPGFGAGASGQVTDSTPSVAQPSGGAAPTVQDDLFADEPEPTDEERVIALERSLLSDEVRGDPAAVAALLHPDFCEIGRSGRLWTRPELLAHVAPLAEPATLEVLSVSRVAPQAILLLWRSAGDEATDGSSSVLRSSLWVRAGGDWVQRFHQGTREPIV